MNTSFKTTILDVTVYHCIDGEKEHYCVDLNGYYALQDFLATEEIGDVRYNKVPIKYNPNLDGGSHGSGAENAEGCRAKECLP